MELHFRFVEIRLVYFARVLVTKIEEQQIVVFIDEMKMMEFCRWFSQEVIYCSKLLDLSSVRFSSTHIKANLNPPSGYGKIF